MEQSWLLSREPDTLVGTRLGHRQESATESPDKRFRLMLIQEDGRPIDQAILDMQNCGLPANTDLLLLTVRQLFPGSSQPTPTRLGHSGKLGATPEASEELELAAIEARAKLLAAFPLWEVQSTVSSRSSQAVIEEAARWKPEMIVLGATHTSGSKSRAFRSLIRKLVTESHFPIRISRANSEVWSFRRPILIAFDSASGADAIVKALSRRKIAWGADIKLLFCAEPLGSDGVTVNEGFAEPKREWIAGQLVKTKLAIEAMGHKVRSVGFVGNTAQTILEQAQRMDAESIIIGKGDHDVLTDLVAQSVAATVAANASFPVEIVCARPRQASHSQAIAA